MHNYWLGMVCNAAYFQLPLGLTLGYLVEKKRSRNSARRAQWLFLLIGLDRRPVVDRRPATPLAPHGCGGAPRLGGHPKPASRGHLKTGQLKA
jgi:hypothetical protein